jgi:hypothetical protein
MLAAVSETRGLSLKPLTGGDVKFPAVYKFFGNITKFLLRITRHIDEGMQT